MKKVLQLINTRVDPSRVLRLLSVLALHGDTLVKQEVIRRGRRVLDAIHAHRDNMLAAEFGVVALSHALEATYLHSGHEPFDFKDLLSAVLTLSTTLLCDPHPSHNLVLHIIPILIHGVEMLSRGHLQQITPQLEFFAALTRSTNISLRRASLIVFQTLNPREVNNYRPRRPPFSVRSHQIPPLLRRALEDYGFERCETWLVERFTNIIVKAVHDFVKDRDLYKFGVTMAEHLPQSTYIHRPEDYPDFAHPSSPYTTWKEYLPAAAKILRKRGDAVHLDMADILDLEYMFSGVNVERRVSFAREVLARNPQHAFAHMVLCVNLQYGEEAEQVAKDGLDLPSATPFLRRFFLRRLMAAGAAIASSVLLAASPSDERMRRDGTQRLDAALRYAEQLMNEAPPDSTEMIEAIDFYLAYTFVLRGSELSDDLSELQVRALRRASSGPFEIRLLN